MFKSGIPIGTRPSSHTPNIMGTNEEPWMTRDSISFIHSKISNMKNKNLLEFGSGSSTAWFLKVLNCNVTSVEHDKYWLDNVKNKIPDKLQYNWTPIFKPPLFSGNCKGSSDELFYDDYVHSIDNMEKFDIIVVDGRARSHCILNSIDKLNNDGIFIVDNAERHFYKKAIDKIPTQWFKYVFPCPVDTTIVWHKS